MCRIVIYGCKDVTHISTKGAETLITCNINKQDAEVTKTNKLTTEIKVCHGVLAQVHKLKFSGNTKDFNTTECYEPVVSWSEINVEQIKWKHEPEIQAEMEEESIVVKVEPEESYVSNPMDDVYFVTTIKEEEAESCPMDLLVDPMEGPSNQRIYECNYCSLPFDNRDKLERHMKIHIKRQFNEFPESTQRDHQRKHLRFKCKMCGKLFQYKSYLIKHINRHKIRNFKCEFCKMEFHTRESLKNHLTVHKESFCPICGKVFNRDSLTKHKRRHEYKAHGKLHKCPMCHKEYFYASDLRRHFRNHKGKNFKCEHCDSAFVRKDHLQKHMDTMHLSSSSIWSN